MSLKKSSLRVYIYIYIFLRAKNRTAVIYVRLFYSNFSSFSAYLRSSPRIVRRSCPMSVYSVYTDAIFVVYLCGNTLYTNVNTMEHDNVLLCLWEWRVVAKVWKVYLSRHFWTVFSLSSKSVIRATKSVGMKEEEGRKEKIKKQLQSIECERELTEEKVPVWWGS